MWCWEAVVKLALFSAVASGVDAMFCIAKLIEMLTIQERSLFIRTELPRVYHKTHTVRCPWTVKGR